MEAELRRHRDTLIILGNGALVFAIWSLIKTILMTLVSSDYALEAGLMAQDGTDRAINIGAYMFGLIFVFAVYTYIGICARAEGKGKRKGMLYIVTAFFLIAIETIPIIYMLLNLSETLKNVDPDELIVSILISVTQITITAELLYAVYKVRTISRRMSEEDEIKCK